MTGPSPVRPGNAQFAPVAATVRLGHLIFQTKRWNEAIRMADLKGAVAIARHYHAGSVRAARAEILRRTVAATVIWLGFRRCRRYRRSFVTS
jgi:hypothetical protein